jgi:hypothetical protein
MSFRQRALYTTNVLCTGEADSPQLHAPPVNPSSKYHVRMCQTHGLWHEKGREELYKNWHLPARQARTSGGRACCGSRQLPKSLCTCQHPELRFNQTWVHQVAAIWWCPLEHKVIPTSPDVPAIVRMTDDLAPLSMVESALCAPDSTRCSPSWNVVHFAHGECVLLKKILVWREPCVFLS